jgi:hypothetical protein
MARIMKAKAVVVIVVAVVAHKKLHKLRKHKIRAQLFVSMVYTTNKHKSPIQINEYYT